MGQFADAFYNFQVKVGTQTDKLIKQVVYDTMYSLVDKSPVGDPSLWAPSSLPAPKDYEGGKFRANWQVGIDSLNDLTTDDIDPTGEISLETALSIPDTNLAGHIYYLSNSLPYAQVLEDGEHSSQVPPHGMVGLTFVEFPDIFNKAVAKI